MTQQSMIDRLLDGKTANAVYRRVEFEGLLSAWCLGDRFILTWEECPLGQQYDESTYTRDERFEFATAQDLVAFVDGKGYPPSAFLP